MEQQKNPFPGMNPFLERKWPSVHAKLISLIDDEIGRQLPDGLVARPEERVVIDDMGQDYAYRADVVVQEEWKQGIPPVWKPDAARTEGVAVTEPQIIVMEEHPERWVEIRTAEGVLVTVIEVLSPSNKLGGAEAYRNKQRAVRQTTASLVEIDLLRAGRYVLAAPSRYIKERAHGTCYHVCVSRSWKLFLTEFYSCPLRERLPAFRVPLREQDADVVLDLQPLVDRVYEAGRYHLSRYDLPLEPPFEGEEADWVNETLRQAGLLQ